MTEYWLIKVAGDVEPDLEGPFHSDDDRLAMARSLRIDDDFDGGLYRLNIIDGKPSIESFAGWELE